MHGRQRSGGRAVRRGNLQEWALCQHFLLYDDVPAALRALAAEDILIGLISNSHRCLESFQEHFELDGLIDVAVSSSQHGYMKPHPSIFEAALKLAGVAAADAVMVGDSLTQDIDGARGVGMRGVLVRRSDSIEGTLDSDVPVIKAVTELSALLSTRALAPATYAYPGGQASDRPASR